MDSIKKRSFSKESPTYGNNRGAKNLNRTQYIASTITNRKNGGAQDYDSERATMILLEDSFEKTSACAKLRTSKQPLSSDIITV